MNRAKALIEGGRTERFHCTPHHRPYPVGLHSWNMAALLEVLWPNAPIRLLKACLFHDVAERWVGDMPAPGKWWISQEANNHLKGAEGMIKHKLQVDYETGLTQEEQNWLKALDLFELWVYCREEISMGNENVRQTYSLCGDLLSGEWVPVPVREAMVDRGNWQRTDDAFGHRA